MRAGIALGSNVGDRLANLRAGRECVANLARVEPPVLASLVYETAPVDCEPGARNFLNAVIEIGFTGEALELLGGLRRIERELGRPATHARNTSRTIDLDLLYFGHHTSDSPDLKLPHPRMHERAFVLKPLSDIQPHLVLPHQLQTIAALLDGLADASGLVKFEPQW